ncbi:RECEPTOR-LIKE PROTEIN 55 [Salix purpurea]|uniref:RECEPTOR-LIKE PROTEIN 55 n=1 Tax=Salix purpurea TaxID=77065 RepID=A0A9Q0U9X9_SALPP|nr:RECEPTOR-LIKE PROTEIN 55 [Salix purpurea]
MAVQDLWVLFLVLGFLMLRAQVLQSQNLTCSQNDLKALQDFMRGLKLPIQGWNATNSSSPDCCNWLGITCTPSSSLGLVNDSVDSGRVTKLELPNQRLNGELVESIGSLDQLRTLNLSHNFLKNLLPFSLFHFPKLEVLDLNSNDFSGSIPQSISLPSIIFLDISSNYLNGSLPTHICQNSSGIQALGLAVNYFSGTLSPGLGSCTTLEHLCLGMNDLTGGISEDIFQLQKLKLLGLQDNKLSGNLSAGISKLRSLERLDISSNGFSGTIPDVFHSLSKLKFFLGHSNDFVGTIPHSLANSPSLNLLNLRNNSLGGIIDLNCSALTNLSSLDLATNNFSGPVPVNLPSCKNLKNINLARNKFTGQIPESFQDFQGLSFLSFSNCSISNLSSALQILQQCKNLTTLVLTLNFHGEALPDNPALHFENLKVLVMANCKLTGSMPQWLTGSSKLQLVDLSWNRLTGPIPSWFGGFLNLFYLDLSNNSFTGEIPKSLTELPSLINRSISIEDPSPDFPFFLSRNQSGRGLQYNQVWSFPSTLALSDNLLTGQIWPQFGNLKKLHVFELSYNRLSGPIPSELSGMTSLETLYLSHNNLSGTIPWSLVNLSFLSKFSVAYNQLHGKIPTGIQFMTFPNSSFEGNHLCGDHGAPPCPKSDQVPPEASRKSGRNKVVVIVGMVVGIFFGTAFLLTLMIMIVLRANSRGEVDPEWVDAGTDDKELEEFGSGLVVLLQNKECYKDLSLENLLKSTNNFDQANIIGCGGFGLVYRATLPDGRKLAIKRLSGDCGQMDREFHAEVEALSRAQHPNLMKKENRESEVFDPFIYDKQNDKELHRVFEIACLCLSEYPKLRPSTEQLVSWLDNIDTNTNT